MGIFVFFEIYSIGYPLFDMSSSRKVRLGFFVFNFFLKLLNEFSFNLDPNKFSIFDFVVYDNIFPGLLVALE